MWNRSRDMPDGPNWRPESQQERENFMLFDEFVRYREEIKLGGGISGPQLHDVFELFMSVPRPRASTWTRRRSRAL